MLFQTRGIVEKASIQTDNPMNTAGLMNPEQSTQFMRMAFDATPLMQACRHEMRRVPKGEIDKIGIAGRIIQKKTEGQAGTERTVAPSKIEYSCVDITLPWSISEKTLRENIERQGYEGTVVALMSNAYGVDLEDLGIIGDTDFADSNDNDYNFIRIVDGWGKKLAANAAKIVSPQFELDMWYDMAASIQSKYKTDRLRWIVSPNLRLAWRKFCETKAMSGGNTNLYNSDAPCGYGMITVPKMSDSQIWLTDPKNLITVNTYDMTLRRTTEGKDAIQKDERYYAIHGNVDFIVEEYDAAAIATGIDLTGGVPALTALTIGSLTLTPEFNKGSHVYTAATTNTKDAITATVSNSGTAAITVNGATVANGGEATWDTGANTVVVTVENSAYIVTVTKS